MATDMDFYYGLGSRYSYLAATQIEALEAEFDINVQWHPANTIGIIANAMRWIGRRSTVFPLSSPSGV